MLTNKGAYQRPARAGKQSYQEKRKLKFWFFALFQAISGKRNVSSSPTALTNISIQNKFSVQMMKTKQRYETRDENS